LPTIIYGFIYTEEENAMRKIVAIALSIAAMACFTFSSPAWAGDLANGGKIFSANCAACHAGGKNVVNAAKTLQKGDLDKYSMNSLEAIKTQVTKGKNAMPAFGGRLSEEQIDDVASYVLAQAEKGW
jgi:cytochrome c6